MLVNGSKNIKNGTMLSTFCYKWLSNVNYSKSKTIYSIKIVHIIYHNFLINRILKALIILI